MCEVIPDEDLGLQEVQMPVWYDKDIPEDEVEEEETNELRPH